MAMIRTRTIYTGLAGSPYYSEQYWLGDADGTHALAAVNAMGNFIDACDAFMDNGLSWTVEGDVDVIDISTGDITAVHSVTPRTGAGGASDSGLPPATQMLCRLQTGYYVGGRQLRGKIFLPGFTIGSNNSSGAPDSTIRASITTNLGTLVGHAADLCVYSRVHHVGAGVTTGTVWDKWAVLRSRRD